MSSETSQSRNTLTSVMSDGSIEEYWVTNTSNGTEQWTLAPLPDHFRKVPWPQLTVMIVVLVFGVVANLSIIFIVLKNKRLRSTPNIIVVNLTVGDLLCLVVNLPLIIDYHFRYERNWVFGQFMCKFAHSSMVASGCITVYSLMALAIERYLAIAWPWRNRDSSRCVKMSRNCFLGPTWQIVLMIWVGAFLVGAPIWYTAQVYVYYDDVNVCMFINHGQPVAQVYKVFRLLVAFLIPLAVIIGAHTLTAYALIKSVREPVFGGNPQVSPTNRQTPRVRSRVKLAIVITVLSAMFFIAWSPFYLFSIWFQFYYSEIFETYAMLEFFRWKDVPIYMLSCLNPVALYILSTRFRHQLFNDIFCCFGDRRFAWKPSETFSSLKGSFFTASTFRSRSHFNRRSSSCRYDQGTPVAASSEEL
ncbi:bombesin receptor subtype-3-like [Lytechinus variegatus]|uniref:bombesin receptor subtype-3-like n=1 Tax=Lytechinus variegatus TaxID=7654 RepID=UPI001BB25027|nr:bombesin receptor subtype-3-like [Lytechinus variegatus]